MRKPGWPFVCALILTGAFCFASVSDTDTGWHIAVGRLVLHSGIPRTNALSWAYGSTPWYATSWLYDAALALLPQPLGAQLLTFALLALTLFALAAAAGWATPVIALLLLPRLVPRPHVASWAVLAAVLALAPRSLRARVACIVLVAIGGNLHAGAAFAAGVLGLEALEAFWRTRRRAELAVALGAGLALLANPGFLFDARYLLEHLTHVNAVIQLSEFDPPTLLLRPWFFGLLAVTIPLAVLRRRERPALLVATVVFAALGLRALRMVMEAQLVFAPTLAWGLSRLPRRAVAPAIAAALLALVLPLRLPPLGPRWNSRLLPVRAAQFLDATSLGTRGYNAFRDGGYLEYARPGVPAFVDGRVQAVPEEAWRTLQESEKSPEAFRAHLHSLGCEWAMATRVRERIGGYGLLHDAPEWALVYWDDVSEIYVRRDLLGGRFEYRWFHPWGHVLSAPDLRALLAEVARFQRTTPYDAFAAVVRCGALTRLGAPEAAQACDISVPPEFSEMLSRARQAAP